MLRAIAIVLIILPVILKAGPVKRWTDSEGKIHFGDVPPVSTQADVVTIQPLTGGKGLSSKQIKLADKIRKREARGQKVKLKAEKASSKKHQKKKKIDEAYRRGKLMKGMTARQVRNLLGEPNSIESGGDKKGNRQKWIYEKARAGKPGVVYIRDGLYSSHRNKTIKK